MRASLIALVLVSAPCAALAQSDQDWKSRKAVDADHLVIPACTRLIESNNLAQNDRAIAYAIRGTAHLRQRDFDEAIADESKAIDIDPNNAVAYSNRSLARGHKADLDGAIADTTRALEINPKFASGLIARGIAHQMKHEYRKKAEQGSSPR
jgi:tetratricopeptide (TPR) repeat protein